MRVHDSLIGLIIFIGGICICITASSFPSQMDGSPGPALFPMVLSGLFSICGAILFVKNFKTISASNLFVRNLSLGGLINILIVIALIIFYGLAVETLGFLLCMEVVLLALMLMLKTTFVKALIVSVCATIVIYLIFAKASSTFIIMSVYIFSWVSPV